MKHKRKSSARIQTTAQLRAVVSPVSIEIIEALQAGGPASVSELGPRVGRRANSLHYHVRRLSRVGLIRKVDARRSGARTEAVYDVIADCFTGQTAPKCPLHRKLTNNAVASLLRLTARDFSRAAGSRAKAVQGSYRNLLADRHKAWLTPSELAKVNRHLDALDKLFANNQEPGRGRLCALTMILTPLTGSVALSE